MHPLEDEGCDLQGGSDLDHEAQAEMHAMAQDITAAIENLQQQATSLRQAHKPMEAAALEFHIHIIERTQKAIRGRH
jgi:hypothetical protein